MWASRWRLGQKCLWSPRKGSWIDCPGQGPKWENGRWRRFYPPPWCWQWSTLAAAGPSPASALATVLAMSSMELVQLHQELLVSQVTSLFLFLVLFFMYCLSSLDDSSYVHQRKNMTWVLFVKIRSLNIAILYRFLIRSCWGGSWSWDRLACTWTHLWLSPCWRTGKRHHLAHDPQYVAVVMMADDDLCRVSSSAKATWCLISNQGASLVAPMAIFVIR